MGFKIYYWPGLTFGLHMFTFLLTYAISVSTGHVYHLFPYISDTGTKIPESCIFGQMMNFGAVCLAITLYIRYRQVDFGIDSDHISVTKTWNKVALWLAVFMSIGISIVANFQETAILPIHLLGAFMVFGLGTVYFALQTRISYGSVYKFGCTNPDYRIGRNMFFIRIFFSFSLFPLLLINGVCGLISFSGLKGRDMSYWTEEHGDFEVRLASTFTEWILVIFFFLYILTFTNEFKSLTFEEIKIRSKYIHLNEAQEIRQLAKV